MAFESNGQLILFPDCSKNPSGIMSPPPKKEILPCEGRTEEIKRRMKKKPMPVKRTGRKSNSARGTVNWIVSLPS